MACVKKNHHVLVCDGRAIVLEENGKESSLKKGGVVARVTFPDLLDIVAELVYAISFPRVVRAWAGTMGSCNVSWLP